jgi:hypothetical protein
MPGVIEDLAARAAQSRFLFLGGITCFGSNPARKDIPVGGPLLQLQALIFRVNVTPNWPLALFPFQGKTVTDF